MLKIPFIRYVQNNLYALNLKIVKPNKLIVLGAINPKRKRA
jgi:hypothetical protein